MASALPPRRSSPASGPRAATSSAGPAAASAADAVGVVQSEAEFFYDVDVRRSLLRDSAEAAAGVSRAVTRGTRGPVVVVAKCDFDASTSVLRLVLASLLAPFDPSATVFLVLPEVPTATTAGAVVGAASAPTLVPFAYCNPRGVGDALAEVDGADAEAEAGMHPPSLALGEALDAANAEFAAAAASGSGGGSSLSLLHVVGIIIRHVRAAHSQIWASTRATAPAATPSGVPGSAAADAGLRGQAVRDVFGALVAASACVRRRQAPGAASNAAGAAVAGGGTTSSLAAVTAAGTRPLDVQLTVMSASVYSSRRTMVCAPMPAWLLVGGTPNFERIAAAIERTPRLASLDSATRVGALDDDSLRLLHWLLFRAPSQFAALGPGVRSLAAEYPSGHYLVPSCELAVAPPRDPLFDRLAGRHGTYKAFHGSAVSNMHSITQRGLRNFSGTRNMTTGAVFGDGIYAAADLQVAKSFAPVGAAVWGNTGLYAARGSAAAAGAGAPSDAAGGSGRTPPLRCKLCCIVACEVVALPENMNRLTATVSASAGAGAGAAGSGGSAALSSSPSPSASASTTSAGGGGSGSGHKDAYYIVKQDRHVRLCSLLVYVHGVGGSPSSTATASAAAAAAAVGRVKLAGGTGAVSSPASAAADPATGASVRQRRTHGAAAPGADAASGERDAATGAHQAQQAQQPAAAGGGGDDNAGAGGAGGGFLALLKWVSIAALMMAMLMMFGARGHTGGARPGDPW